MNNFLPEGYKEEAGGYMKLETGKNRFRILSSAIVGWEGWNEDKEGNHKPLRKRLTEDLISSDFQEPEKIKRFWAFIVWNYKDEAIQILEITQKGIRQSITALINNKKWGTPVNSYDIVITREGEKLKTKYTVTPDPKEPTEKEITNAFKKKPINLEALFSNDDPFKSLPEDVNPDEVDL